MQSSKLSEHSFWKSGSCGTESNAFRKSKNTAHMSLPTSSSFSQSSVHLISAVTVDRPSWKPHCCCYYHPVNEALPLCPAGLLVCLSAVLYMGHCPAGLLSCTWGTVSCWSAVLYMGHRVLLVCCPVHGAPCPAGLYHSYLNITTKIIATRNRYM